MLHFVNIKFFSIYLQCVLHISVSDQHIGTGCKHPETSKDAKSSAYFISLLQEGEIQTYWLCYDTVRGINTVARTLSGTSLSVFDPLADNRH